MVNVIIVSVMNKSRVLVIAMTLVMLMTAVKPAAAAKKRVWTAAAVSTSTVSSGSFSVSARLTGWKQYLNISFKGVASTTGVTYELVYNGNNTEQGVYGSVKASEGNVTRTIFLGTCSHGACTAHKNVSDIKLTITYKTAGGQSITKKYKVKY